MKRNKVTRNLRYDTAATHVTEYGTRTCEDHSSARELLTYLAEISKLAASRALRCLLKQLMNLTQDALFYSSLYYII
jgi:chemotaxis regulatin CheY-phosphate phosphatase CheZ